MNNNLTGRSKGADQLPAPLYCNSENKLGLNEMLFLTNQ